MLLLALDTSTRQASVALCTEQVLLGEYTWQVGNNHSVELLEHIQRLFAECAIAMSALDGIAVATGPGSFNGLRVALTTAKSLAFALRKPLVGISTLDVIAAEQHGWTGPICAVLEAGRSELYVACYAFEGSDDSEIALTDVRRLRRLSDYQILSPREVGVLLHEQMGQWLGVPGQRELPPFLLCGEISVASREALHTHIQQKQCFAGMIASSRHASVLALLAMRRMQESQDGQDRQVDDPLLLEPLYLRRPSITTSTRKKPLLGGSSSGGSRPTGQSETEREEGALRH